MSRALFFKVCSPLGAETAVDGEGEKGGRGGCQVSFTVYSTGLEKVRNEEKNRLCIQSNKNR